MHICQTRLMSYQFCQRFCGSSARSPAAQRRVSFCEVRPEGERWLYMENPYSTELKLLGWDRETEREIERVSERSDAVERDPLCTACPIAAECCQLYYSARAAAILSQTHITVSTHIKEQSPTGGKCVTTDDNFTIHSAISLASSDQPLQSFAFALKSTAFVRLS